MAEGHVRRLARNHDFTVLWVGQTISDFGAAMSLFVFPLLTYAITGSATRAAVVSAALAVGKGATLLPAGALVDRWHRKRVLLAASGSGAVLYASLVFAQLIGVLTVPHLAIVALLSGVASSFFSPAEIAAVRTAVPESDLPAALSQNQARTHVANLAGAPVGGALYGLARWAPFAVDAITYAISCLAISRIRTPLPAPGRPAARTRLREDVREGIAYVWRWPFMRVLLSNAALMNATFGAFFLVLVLRMIDAGVHPAAIGATESAAGVAGILGALAGPSLIDRWPTGWLTIVSIWALVLAVLPLVFTVDPWVVGGCLMVGLFLNPIGNAGVAAYRVLMTPDDLQGRTHTAVMFIATLAMPLGAPLGGVLMSTVGGQAAMATVLALTAVGALQLTLSRSIRSVPRPDRWRAHADRLGPTVGEFRPQTARIRARTRQ
jgi:predicted MFS family arabinose efflux permease